MRKNTAWPRPLLTILFSLIFSSTAGADYISETFSSNSLGFTGTAILNLVTGFVHPPFQVYQWQATGSPSFDNTGFSVGDGHHGVFDSTRYAEFSSGGDTSGSIIRIDTSAGELQFTSFTLDAGWKIIPIGNQPLIIRSQSDMQIDGQILCNGSVGSSANASISTVASGGSGACGGGNGGNSGTGGASPQTAGSGTIGVANSATITGGGGSTVADGSGGGGGGGFNTGAQGPTVATGTSPGTIGNSQLDGQFSLPGGGTGGGGGSPLTGSGAGGGGGGGVIHLVAARNLTVSATGLIQANGGNGGGGANLGGAGGGGAGGSVLVLAGSTLTIDGLIEAKKGSKGTAVSGNGGDGGAGRIWATDSLGSYGGAGSINPTASGLIDVGVMRYQTGSFSLESNSFQLNGSFTTNFSVTVSDTNANLGSSQILLAGSQSDFASDTTSFLDVNSYSQLDKSKYLKIHIDITNTDLTTPYQVDSVLVTYNRGSAPEFNYQGMCGEIGSNSSSGPGAAALQFLILCLPLFLALWMKHLYQEYPKRRPTP